MPEENRSTKKPVGVYAYISPEGCVRPLKTRWDDEHHSVDKIYDICPAASLKAGGFGMRYNCRINGRDTHLFQEDGGIWFIDTDSIR